MPLKKESSCYLFCKTKPRHSSQIFLTVRMIEEGWYFIGQSLACVLALTPTQWLQSRRGNCMCQCPKEKKQTGFIIAMFWNSVITGRLYATLQAQRDWLGVEGGKCDYAAKASSSSVGTICSGALQHSAQGGFPEPGEPWGEPREPSGPRSSCNSGWQDLGRARSNGGQATPIYKRRP